MHQVCCVGRIAVGKCLAFRPMQVALHRAGSQRGVFAQSWPLLAAAMRFSRGHAAK